MSSNHVPVVGLIGGIGSGKSSVAARIAAEVSAVILDADATGHAALSRAEVKDRLKSRFGTTIFDENNEVIRHRLAEVVFGDSPDQQQRRESLNQILHPIIRTLLLNEYEIAQSKPGCQVVLLDAALLLEAGWADLCDLIVFVDVPHAQRVNRVMGRGWDAAELARREASQLSVEEKKRRADLIVDNSGSVDEAASAVLHEINRRFGRMESVGPQPVGTDSSP